jgi:methionyl-tRNA synthetase
LSNPKRYLITAALPYANGPLHLGHLSGAYLPADIYVRYLKMKGEDVAFICGSDEHGAAITLRAKKDGVTPQEIVDKYHTINKKAFSDLGIDFSIYDRTSSTNHHKVAQDFFTVLNNKGALTTETTEQYFDVENNQFLADRYISGECPKCANPNAYGDQCEKCGSTLSPTELINPKSTISGNVPILKETSHWFLPMERHEEWLTEWIEKGSLDGKQLHNPKEWRNQVIGQCMSWINAGLKPRAMTRDLDWGVKVPVEGADGKVLYVWLDAPIGYISATQKWAKENNKNWEDYWKKDDTKVVNFIGKDNIVFHAIIFPILLKEHGDYILPNNVAANEFLNLEGDKFSTSRNWAVWLHEYIEQFPDKTDELRYVLASTFPESKDAEFTWKDYQDRINNELVAIFGNFVNRVVVLTNKYYEGVIPTAKNLTKVDLEIIEEVKKYGGNISKSIEAYRFREALGEAMNIARAGNKYLADMEPWKLVKTDAERVETIMKVALQITANLAIAFEPFLPKKSAQLKDMLNLNKELAWNDLGSFTLLQEGEKINPAELLFNKIEDEMVTAQVQKLEDSKSVDAIFEPVKEEISFEDFTKLDIRIGTILEAEKVKKAKKLLQLKVDIGFETRTIVSGIAEHYQPEDVIGQKVTVLLNLAPREIRGVKSEGMILMAENAKGELSFVSPTEDKINAGDGVA